MKRIKIFLASSIVEFERERDQLENFIYQISEQFEDAYNISIRPLRCENVDPAMNHTRKQDEYNELIKESDMCFFIFFTKVGEYTREEFDIAWKSFQRNDKPKIYTYFKETDNEEQIEQSVKDFMKELDQAFSHYYKTFRHIDTIKLRMLLGLKLQEMDFIEIKMKDSQCIVDGKPMLDLQNVSEYANNTILKELREELETTEKEYYDLKPKYLKSEDDMELYKRYSDIASKRQNLIDQIEELENSIFNLSLRMVKDEMRGEITSRQREAYQLFEKGDLEGANNILDFEEIKSDYERRRAIKKEEIRRLDRRYIREIRTKIEILQTMTKYKGRFEEIEELYEEIVPIIEDSLEEVDALYDYSIYLHEQNRDEKALEILNKLNGIYEEHPKLCTDEKKSSISYLLGLIYSMIPQQQEKAEKYYLSAIEIKEKLSGNSPEQNDGNLAKSYNALGVYYHNQGNYKKAEIYFQLAINIQERMAKHNSKRYEVDLATSYNNLGVYYDSQGESQRAENYYLSAIKIQERLIENDYEQYKEDLARSYSNLGVYYDDQRAYQEAENYYLSALEIRESLAKYNPKYYESELVDIYNNLGIYYECQGAYQEAEKYYLLVIEVQKRLVEQNSKRHEGNLSRGYHNLGIYYSNQRVYPEAEKYLLLAIEIRERLVEYNRERYEGELAGSYNSLGILYHQCEYPEAEKYLLLAIEIQERLVEYNPKQYESDLAGSYNNLAIYYKDQGEYKKAEKYYLFSINIWERLTKQNPKRYEEKLAISHNALGIYYDNQGRYQEAEKYYLSAKDIWKKLAEQNPKRYIENLAIIYNNLGAFYKEFGEHQKSKKYYLLAIEIWKVLAKQNPKRYEEYLTISYNNLVS